MKATINRQIILISRPSGTPEENNFRLIETPTPTPAQGELLIRTIYLSPDPYMRGRMRDRKSYVEPFKLNQPLTGGVVGQVVESLNHLFAAGDLVSGFWGWQDYSISNGQGLQKIDPNMAPISTYLGVLGMPGLTAYFGLLDIGKPVSGETVVISAAAGAVGSTVGQIAKTKGCRVIGIAGTDAKANFLLNDLGFDGAVNYKKITRLDQALLEICPQGIDVYFDNVGGEITDAVLTQINLKARIVLCGQIALYNLEKPALGPRNLFVLIEKRARMEGFLVADYAARFQEGRAQLAQWLSQDKLKFRENIINGLENAPRAFIGLFKGENIGKQLIKVSDYIPANK